jgi:hypothetical protein
VANINTLTHGTVLCVHPIIRITDEEAKRIVFNIAGTRTIEEFQRLSGTGDGSLSHDEKP